MYLHEEVIECKSRSDRVEIFPFYDCHIGKRNCNESAIKKQVSEILRQHAKPDRQARVVMGGDICDVIKPQDIRYDVNEVADWFLQGEADDIRDQLNNIAKFQIDRATKLFTPIKDLLIGGIEANHDKAVRKRYNHDTHRELMSRLGCLDMTDECIIRFKFIIRRANSFNNQVVQLYMRHGYGGGRTPGVEPAKIERMMGDGVTHNCDVALTGHTHTFCKYPPVPVLYMPNKGRIPPQLLVRYRYGANPGSWLLSHKVGKGSYESASCYPSRAMMTLKIVIWPFWSTKIRGKKKGRADYAIARPKIEIRDYTIA
jgi:hypothetical protein